MTRRIRALWSSKFWVTWRGQLKGLYVFLCRTQAGLVTTLKSKGRKKYLATTYKPFSESLCCSLTRALNFYFSSIHYSLPKTLVPQADFLKGGWEGDWVVFLGDRYFGLKDLQELSVVCWSKLYCQRLPEPLTHKEYPGKGSISKTAGEYLFPDKKKL